MKRGTPLRRTPLRSISKKKAEQPPKTKKRKRIGPNRKRRAWKFARNFHSEGYVLFTKRSRCLFCGSRDRVVTAHLLEGRKAGGCGGDYRATGPACFECDDIWTNKGRFTLLHLRGMTMDELAVRVAAHHERWVTEGAALAA